MGLGELFLASLLPVLKVAMLCGVGALLAWKGMLTHDGRRAISSLVFYLFSPCLFLDRLGSGVGFQGAFTLWPLMFNLLASHTIGALLGIALVIVIRAPREIRKHMVLCCALGNSVNLPLVLVASLGDDPALAALGGAALGVQYIILSNIAGTFIQLPPSILLLRKTDPDIMDDTTKGKAGTREPLVAATPAALTYKQQQQQHAKGTNIPPVYQQQQPTDPSHPPCQTPASTPHAQPPWTLVPQQPQGPWVVQHGAASNTANNQPDRAGVDGYAAVSLVHGSTLHGTGVPDPAALNGSPLALVGGGTGPVVALFPPQGQGSSAPDIQPSVPQHTLATAHQQQLDTDPLMTPANTTNSRDPLIVHRNSNKQGRQKGHVDLITIDEDRSLRPDPVLTLRPDQTQQNGHAGYRTAGLTAASDTQPLLHPGASSSSSSSSSADGLATLASPGYSKSPGNGAAAALAAQARVHMLRVKGVAAARWPMVQVVVSSIVSVPTVVAVIALTIASIPPVQALFFSPTAPLRILAEVVAAFGDLAIPCLMLVLGANLSRGPGVATIPLRCIVGTVVLRLVVAPIAGTGMVVFMRSVGLLDSLEPIGIIVMLIPHATPTAIMLHSIATMYNNQPDDVAALLFWEYLASALTLPFVMAAFLKLVTA